MKQMSLIEMDGFLKGKCIPRDLKVNETNAEYLVRKFGELESKLETALRECRSAGITIDNLDAKCAALAAENELARKAVQEFCDVVGDSTEVICEEIGRDGVLVILEAMKATGNMPATDAFLAEVRAQGVEKLAALAGNESQRYKSVNDRAGARKWKSIVILCCDFAAQLRQEASK